jgi:proteasome lid subunit RPN8/RPN11
MSSLDIRAIDEKDLRKEPFPSTKHELQVYLAEEAFDRAVERGDSDTSREIGGVLVGELLRDEGGPYLKIETTIDALHAEEKGAELTFTHATWEHINKEMDTKYQGKKVVGWYHTHPGFGVFLSDRDQFIHKSFFNLPFQVAFVYDPKSKDHGLFTWRDNEVWRMRRYAIGGREHTWDGNRTTARPKDEATEKLADNARSDARDSKDGGEDISLGGSLGPLILIAVVLVLVAGFAGHWIGASSANSAIMQAQVEVVKARNEGAQMAIASLQNDLVGLLRETLGDQAVHKPVAQAISDLDTVIAKLELTGAPSAGSAAPPAIDPRLADAITQLKTAREGFFRLAQDRGSAEAILSNIQRATRPGAELKTDLVHDVAEQRVGVGGLYAEMAADAAKAGDMRRAHRLLVTAAHLDPGNRSRYEKQLQSFDKDAKLPRESGESEGSASVTPAVQTIPGATVPTAPAAPAAKDEGAKP